MLEYYRKQSPITNPGQFSELFDPLPDYPGEMIEVIHGLIIHKLVADAYHEPLSQNQRSEQHLRSIKQILQRIQDLDNAPLIDPRIPTKRLVGVCRDFAVLLTSMLRYKGIPARMRVGFASYFDPEGIMKYDHWITEYWQEFEKRWILADAQIDEIQRRSFRINVDVTDLKSDHDFYFAGSAWLKARAGSIKSTYYRFSGSWKGLPCIRGNLLHDFQSLNKVELNPGDSWDSLAQKTDRELTVADKGLLDRIALLTIGGEKGFTDLRSLFEQMPRSQLIHDRLRVLGIIEPIQSTKSDELKAYHNFPA